MPATSPRGRGRCRSVSCTRPPRVTTSSGDDEFLTRRDLKTAAQHEATRLFLDEDVAFPKRPADFLSDNYAAESRGDDGIALKVAQFVREPAADFRRDGGVLEENRALEKLPAVQAGTQNEMTIQQRAGLAEERKQVVAH